jgi:hypothetical protein
VIILGVGSAPICRLLLYWHILVFSRLELRVEMAVQVI